MNDLKKLYLKDIEREIQGVIKVDDESYVCQELEEYVVTEELLKHFKSFFEAYNVGIAGDTEKMGVWISGFFGSGKSHFLKIISYLLENRVINGKAAVEYFNDKIEDKTLLDAIKKAGNISTDVILFNIDSKTENSNGTKDKILDVFEKVFNEKMGLSITPFVAEIERYIISQGKYEEFKNIFKNVSGNLWEEMRDGIQFVEDEFAQAYAKALGKSVDEARNIVERTEKNYTLSVEKFAERIKEYIKEKGDNHHIVFLVDEIGQYIGDDRGLMLNLQTIVEDLGLECGGKAWVLVTSQEAIDDVIKVQGNDFSKIQGRFDTKLSLSSSDIDEVIKKRILDKTEEAKISLKMIYDKEESIIRNLLTFSEATTFQKVYQDSDDFSSVYPFIPYQFKLLQDVFTDIRKHGYAGKHLSSGERSLLGAFQETAKRFKEAEIGTIIPFYAFYDTIEQFLEHQVKIVINTAIDTVKSGELEEIDVNVLKMLFMLKNIKEIPADIENLSTLYVSNIKDDKIIIKKEITESLRRLEAQTLIQRNNDVYKFLTDEEQEINREIKQISVDQNRITDYLKKIVFDYILIDNKVTYENKNFPLTKYIDNIKYSQEYEIGIKVVTTFPETDDTNIVMQSGREINYVFIKLEISTLIYDEIINYLKVEEYIRSKSGILQTIQIEEILRSKRRENESVEEEIKSNIKKNLSESKIIIAGDKQNIKIKEARVRVNEALEILINNIYTKFNYIKHNYSIQDIKDLFKEKGHDLKNKVFDNQKAYEAMREYCEEKNSFNITMTIRSLLQDFSSAPYGFLDEDILYIITKLMKDEVISLIYNNEVQNITSEDTLIKILKREYYDRTIIRIRQKIDLNLINNLKSVARNVFDIIDLREDEDGMVEDFKTKCLQVTLNELNKIAGYYYTFENKYQYPGLEVKENATNLLEKLLKIKDVGEFFYEVFNAKEELLLLAPKIEMLLDFFSGVQREQFDEARKIIMIYDNNEDYADKTEELLKVVDKIVSILSSNEPYSEIHELPVLRKNLIDILAQMYDVMAEPIIACIKDFILYIDTEIEKVGIDQKFGEDYIKVCEQVIDTLEHSNELKDIFAQQTRIDLLKEKFINALEYEKSKKNAIDPETGKISEDKMIKRTIIRTDSLMGHSYEINSRDDIDIFIDELRNKLIEEFEKNNSLIIR